MSASANKQAAVDGYAAFGAMDAEGAMKDISDAIEWIVGGDNAVTGTYRGKEELGGLWMKLVEKGFSTTPTEFIAEGDKVAVLCDVAIGGGPGQSVDVLDYDADGKLVRFESFGEEGLLDSQFPR